MTGESIYVQFFQAAQLTDYEATIRDNVGLFSKGAWSMMQQKLTRLVSKLPTNVQNQKIDELQIVRRLAQFAAEQLQKPDNL